jgi:hypothetical protein
MSALADFEPVAYCMHEASALAEICLMPYRANTTVTVVPCRSPLSSRTCQP